MVDLTVLGLGRAVPLVAAVAERAPVHLVAATGFYTADVLPLYFQFHGPGRLVDQPEPLVEMFVRDIEEGIAGHGGQGGHDQGHDRRCRLDPRRRLASWTAAATAHARTGVSDHDPFGAAGTRNGLTQLRSSRRAACRRIGSSIGHSGDTEDLDYLREIMDNGSTIGMDRFGMEHVLPDDRRVATVLRLARPGLCETR